MTPPVPSRKSESDAVQWGGEQIGPFRYSESTRIAADVIVRHRRPSIGADLRNPGKYAVYFLDAEGTEERSVGGFDTPRDAARAIPFIVAETIIEDVAVWEADSVEHDV